jgi:hypothetical protein
MAVVLHPHNRWWIALAAIAASMWAIAVSSPWGTMGKGRAVEADGPVRAATAVSDVFGSPVHVARSHRRAVRGSHKRIVLCSGIAGAGDPNDDGASGDPDEDDDNETSKFLDSDDNTDVMIIACFHEAVPYLIACPCASATWTAPPSSHFPTPQPLRC